LKIQKVEDFNVSMISYYQQSILIENINHKALEVFNSDVIYNQIFFDNI